MPDIYRLRAHECGGAVADIGAYCGLVGESAEPLEAAERQEEWGETAFMPWFWRQSSFVSRYFVTGTPTIS